MIWRIAGSYEHNHEARRDLHQDILFAVWRALPRFAGNASLKTYVARIAHNRSISHVSREVAKGRFEDIDPEMPSELDTPLESAEKKDRRDRVQQAIRKLSIDQRQPITLTLEGFKPAEIAEVLGISPNSVSIRLTRAKKNLKMMMEPPHD